MKKIIFFTLCLSAFITFSAAAKIWRVNNNPGVTADFTDLQTAFDSPNVLDGDTIHIEPSPNAYVNVNASTLVVSKRLTILGNGYYLSENLNNQANTYNSIIGPLALAEGSAGSTISGCELHSVYIGGTLPTVSLSDLTISNNLIYGAIVLDGYSPISANVRNNYMLGGIRLNSAAPSGSMSIYNNYIGSSVTLEYDYSVVSAFSGIISNNVILNQVACHSSIVKNNIFIYPVTDLNAVTSNFPNLLNTNTINNNISIGLPLPSTGNNINDADINTLFVGLTDHTTDSQWQLKAGSPAIGAGANGEDCGMFGGANPYKLSGLPAIPSIYSLTTGSSNATILPVTISVKSNN